LSGGSSIGIETRMLGDIRMSKRWDGDDLIEFPSSARDDLRPMSEFDPTSPALVYDEMNDTFLEWQPDWAESYRDQTKELDHRGYPN
jgi:hypothetical protein